MKLISGAKFFFNCRKQKIIIFLSLIFLVDPYACFLIFNSEFLIRLFEIFLFKFRFFFYLNQNHKHSIFFFTQNI